MSEDTTIIDPEVLPPEAQEVIEKSNLGFDTALGLQTAFSGFFQRAEEWREKALAIVITDPSQLREMKIAREARLALREIRLDAEKTRKTLKEDYLRMGKAIDGMANVVKAIVEPLEQHLMDQEKYLERMEEKRRAELTETRSAQLAPYLDVIGEPGFNLADMTDPQWETYMDGIKARAEKIAKEKAEAEAARIEAERKAEEERKRIAAENEKLRKEKEEAEAKAAEERRKAEAERREIEAKAKKEREEAEAKARAAEAERRKLAEEKAAREAAEAKKKADEEAAARKAAAAPDKEKLQAFADLVNQMRVPECKSPEAVEVAEGIQQKVHSFAAWIIQQTEKL